MDVMEPTPDSPTSSYHSNPFAAQSLYARLQKLGEDIQLQHNIINAQKEVVKKTRQRPQVVNPQKVESESDPHPVHTHAGTVLKHRAMLIKHYEIIQQHKQMVKEQGKHVQNLTSTLHNIQQETYVVDELMNTKMAESKRATPTPTSPFLPPLQIFYDNPLPDITSKQPRQQKSSTSERTNKPNSIKVGKHDTETFFTSNHPHSQSSPDVTNSDDNDVYIITTKSNNTSTCSPDTTNDDKPFVDEPLSSSSESEAPDQPFVTTTTTITTTTPNATSTTTISSVTTQTPTSTTTTTSSTTTTMSSLPSSPVLLPICSSSSPFPKEIFDLRTPPLPLSP